MDKVTRRLKKAMNTNDGKIPFEFIMKEVSTGTVIHNQLTPNMRVCVIRLLSGHEVIGVAQVLDANNDVEEIGQGIAKERAIDELWKVFGSIAKIL